VGVHLDLQGWATWLGIAASVATVIGTITTVTIAIQTWRGKWHLRFPGSLHSLELRAIFIVAIAMVPLPIWAWGPTAGLLPSLANLMVLPWVPAYIQKRRSGLAGEKLQDTMPTALFWITGLLVVMNVVALSSALFPEAKIGSYEVRGRIAAARDCNAANKEFELALANYKRARGLQDQARMEEEREYMRLAERRMRQLSCPQTATLPSV
jgi:hypothetical protein